MALTTLKRRAARWLCTRSERAYRTTLNWRAAASNDAVEEIPLTVLMFVGERHTPQAVAALRSFVRYAGRPARVVVGSDGTLRDEDVEALSMVVGPIEV